MRLRRIDRRLLLLGEHCYLDSTDECYFCELYECSRQPGIKPTILSLKRNLNFAITYFAQQLGQALPREWAANYTFVPMPPAAGPPRQVRSMVNQLTVSDARDLLLQRCDTPRSHDGWRLSPHQRERLLVVNELAVDPEPNAIALVDDVLTTGCHYRAAKMTLRRRWPRLRILGIFLARVCGQRGNRCCRDGCCSFTWT